MKLNTRPKFTVITDYYRKLKINQLPGSFYERVIKSNNLSTMFQRILFYISAYNLLSQFLYRRSDYKRLTFNKLQKRQTTKSCQKVSNSTKLRFN